MIKAKELLQTSSNKCIDDKIESTIKNIEQSLKYRASQGFNFLEVSENNNWYKL